MLHGKSLKIVSLIQVLCLITVLSGCVKTPETVANDTVFITKDIPLERNGIGLHLDCTSVEGSSPGKNILLIHGVTYSSEEFDVDYEDYSLIRYLAKNGYNAWKLDIAGFGRSDEVTDGFMPDSDYAALDIEAAVSEICKEQACERIDLLGWSWGTVTTSRFAAAHPEMLDHLILYAPILTGLGKSDIAEPFHKNTWEHAASDFQLDDNGEIDYEIVDPAVVDSVCSDYWRYDKDSSPNGGRRDLCVDESVKLIPLSEIKTPALVICGDNDPYLNMDSVNHSLDELPEGSELSIIHGASHVAMYEKPYYHEFQKRLTDFLKK